MTWRTNVAISLGGLALLAACGEAVEKPDLEATVTTMVATQIAGLATATPLPKPTSTVTPTLTPVEEINYLNLYSLQSSTGTHARF